MDIKQIEELLQAQFPNGSIDVAGGEGKFQVAVVSDAFDGLNQVKRQQSVYKILNEHISSGAIHAVSMRLKTTTEN